MKRFTSLLFVLFITCIQALCATYDFACIDSLTKQRMNRDALELSRAIYDKAKSEGQKVEQLRALKKGFDVEYKLDYSKRNQLQDSLNRMEREFESNAISHALYCHVAVANNLLPKSRDDDKEAMCRALTEKMLSYRDTMSRVACEPYSDFVFFSSEYVTPAPTLYMAMLRDIIAYYIHVAWDEDMAALIYKELMSLPDMSDDLTIEMTLYYYKNMRSSATGVEFDDKLKELERTYQNSDAVVMVKAELIEIEKSAENRLKAEERDYLRIDAMCQEVKSSYPNSPYLGKIDVILRQLHSRSGSINIPRQLYPMSQKEVTISLRNVEAVDVQLYRLSDSSAESLSSRSEIPGIAYLNKNRVPQVDSLAGLSEFVYSQKVRVKPQLNKLVESTITISTKEFGRYLVVVKDSDGETLTGEITSVSRIGANVIKHRDGVDAYVADFESGKAMGEITCNIYLTDGMKPLHTKQLRSKDGFYTLLSRDELQPNTRYTILFEDGKGDKFTPASNIYNRKTTTTRNTNREYQISTYTDRAVYRPGDTVRIHSIVYNPLKELVEGLHISNMIYLPSGKILHYHHGESDRWGGASSEIVIPQNGAAGNYKVTGWSNSDKANSSTQYIKVENYTQPTSEISLTPSREVFLPRDTIRYDGVVAGYDGRTMEGVEVRCKVAYIKRWPKEEVIYQKSVKTNTFGEFSIEFVSDSNSRLYNITAQMIDRNGESREATERVYVHENPYSLRCETPYLLARSVAQPITFTQNPTSDSSVVWSYKIIAEGDDKAILSGTLPHNKSLELPYDKLQDGAYTISWDTQLGGGLLKERNFRIYTDERSSKPISDKVLEVDVPDGRVAEGGALRYIISTSAKSTNAVVIISKGDSLLYSEVKPLKRGTHVCEIDYQPPFVGDVRLQVAAVSDGVRSNTSKNVEYYVPKEEELEVIIEGLDREFTASQSGEFKVRVQERDSEVGVASNLVVTIYDKGSEQIKANRLSKLQIKSKISGYISNINEAFGYAHRWLDFSRGVESKVMIRGMNNTQSASFDEDTPYISVGYGAQNKRELTGGLATRKNFSQTILFRGDIRTNDNGEVTIPFDLSDLLTTYCVKIVAVSRDARSATAEGEFVATKKVMTRTLVPQFLRVGDVVKLQSMATNRLNTSIEATLNMTLFDPQSGRLYSKGSKSCTLLPNSSQNVEWSITPPDNVEHLGLRVELISNEYSDAEQHTIAVDPAVERVNLGESKYLNEESTRARFIPNDLVQEGAFNESMSVAYLGVPTILLRTIAVDRDKKPTTAVEYANAIYTTQVSHLLVRKLPNLFKNTESTAKGIPPFRESFMEYASAMGDHTTAHDQASLYRLRLYEFRNSDGGYSWLKGGKSSLPITLYVARMQRNELSAKCGSYPSGGLTERLELTMRYLDKVMAGSELTSQMLEYLVLRSYDIEDGKFPVKEWNSYIERIKSGWRKLTTHQIAQAALILYHSGVDNRELLEVIRQQAVRYPNSGVTFPSSVANNFSTIIEGNIASHTLIMTLLLTTGEDDDLVREMYKWLMLQRKNQMWINSATTLEVVSTMLDIYNNAKIFYARQGGYIADSNNMITSRTKLERHLNMEVVKQGKPIEVVITLRDKGYCQPAFAELSYSYDAALKDVTPRNSGFEVKREIVGGKTPQVGDIVTIRYTIKSDNDINMAKVRTMKCGAYEPRNNISGYHNGYYREVGADEINYYFDLIPRGETTFEEEFFVWYAGDYADGYVAVESLTNPHYSGNSAVERVVVE